MDEAIKITDVCVEDLDLVWPLVVPLLEGALKYTLGGRSLTDVYCQLVERTASLWISYEDTGRIHAAAVCEIRRYPRRTICVISLMGGEDIELWEEHYKSIGEWAVENGASALVAYARPGVAKRLAAHGFTSKRVVISKELEKRSLH